MNKNLVLLGMMAVGKTTVGKIVAKKQKMEFFDTDENIEKKNSMSIKEIFETKGESFFRTEEEKEVLECIKKKNCVIALGGGAFINKTIRESVLKKTTSFWLDVNIKIINKRVEYSQKRPLVINQGKKKLEDIYEARKKIYKLAHHKIICDKLSKQKIAEEIISLYELH